jgi:carbon-monoxide dehydrogenase large subunit
MLYGSSQTRDEDARLVQGLGQYASDRVVEGAAWMHVVRADMASGRIIGIDKESADKMPGVRLILTGQDPRVQALKDIAIRYIPPGSQVFAHPVRPLATDQVRYMGEPLAVILADNRTQALDAAEALVIDIDIDAAVIDARAAADPKAPQMWPDGNRVFIQEQGDRSGYDTAITKAAHVIKARIEISCVTAVTLETRGSLAVTTGGRTTLFTGTQATHRVRSEAAAVLGLPESDLRIVATDVGGSFGMRNGVYPEDILVITASRILQTPVRWTAERLDAFMSDTLSRPQSVDVTLALDMQHNFLALGVDGYAPVGAYVGAMSMHPMTSSLAALAGVYRTPIVHTIMRGMYVNTMYMAPYRGAGRPEAIFVIERIIDIAAQRLGLDRVTLRRLNMITPDQMPYATPLGFHYDSGDFPKALDAGLKAANWDSFESRREAAAKRGRLRGLGLAYAIESAGAGIDVGQFPEFGAFSISHDSGLTVSAGSGDSGQGHATVFGQIAEHLLGWTGKITCIAGDTDAVEAGNGTFGSRTMGAAGQALYDAANKLIENATQDAARLLDATPEDILFTDGAFRIAGSNRFVSFADLAARTGQIYYAKAFTSTKAGTFPNSVHLAEVEIDAETGELEILNYTMVDDVGTIVNPLLLAGQLHGGVAQGLGQAFMEKIVYDDNGALLSGSLMDYALPRADDLTMFTLLHSPTSTTANALGVKGAGESGTVGALAAGISAVHDALSVLGIEDVAMPATPHRIWQAIQAAKTDQGDRI